VCRPCARPAASLPQGKPAFRALRGHLNHVFSVDFSPRGNILASASFDESVRLWDIRSGRSLRAIPAHSEPVTAAHFNADGTVVVTSSFDGLMCVRGVRAVAGGCACHAAGNWSLS
jgi:WD40 repeat protein